MKTPNTNNPNGLDGLPPGPPDDAEGAAAFGRGDELDVLLREWHDVNRASAAAGRDRLLEALRAEDAAIAGGAAAPAVEAKPAPGLRVERSAVGGWKIWRLAPLAAAAVLALALLAPFMLPPGMDSVANAKATNVAMCPEGGKLEAYDAGGALLGACVLEHTDVEAEISGHLARVTLTQRFKNPHRDKIEAVYTFPMSHSGAVDRMSMAIGDRVIVGEVKEREEARDIYEHAREAGLVAGLTEQERPNIFTQSVANIEPGATIAVTLSYVEFVEEKDGEFEFSFPTVVAPRYIPGAPLTGDRVPGLAADLRPRHGLVLQGPATILLRDRGTGFARSDAGPDRELFNAAIKGATAIETPATLEDETRWYRLEVRYADGTAEPGMYYPGHSGKTSTGHIGGRWFAILSDRLAAPPDVDGAAASEPGAAFAPDTDQVRDASRITPMPVPPGTRSGHDLSIRVKIDTGGPGILGYASPLHRTIATDVEKRMDGSVTSKTIALEKLTAIPNRDFVLTWKQAAEGVTDQVFTHTGNHGNFFGLMLRPPARVDDAMAVPREMIFVVDTSGSMNGFPMEKSKEVMERALASMRAGDTFNVITFAGSTSVLWDKSRPVNDANLAEARTLLATKRGSGGTEMMTAINAALEQSTAKTDKPEILSAEQLLSVYPGGQAVRVIVPTGRFKVHNEQMTDGSNAAIVDESGKAVINVRIDNALFAIKAPSLLIEGNWKGGPYGTVLEMTSIDVAAVDSIAGVRPLRIVMFLTDGQVGNDFAIIDAVKRHRGTTRVFSFGIGNSVNRYLLDSIAHEGGGAAEYVLLESEAAPAVERLTRRTLTPVLTDIRLEFSDNLSVLDIVPPLTNIPDLFDEAPVTILGRYTAPGAGTVTLRGNTAAGPWERTITLSLPEKQPEHDTIATMWARAKIGEIESRDLRGVQNGTLATELKNEIVRLGEQFGIMSEYTSFVAVDKLRVTVAGKPRLVNVPIELPAGTNFEGFFGQQLPMGADDEDQAGSSTRSLRFDDLPEIVRVDEGRTVALRQQAEAIGGRNELGELKDSLATQAGESRSAGDSIRGLAADSATSPPPPAPVTAPPAPAAAAAGPTAPGSAAREPAAGGEPALGKSPAPDAKPAATARKGTQAREGESVRPSARPEAESATTRSSGLGGNVSADVDKSKRDSAGDGAAKGAAVARERNQGFDRKLMQRELAAVKPADPAANAERLQRPDESLRFSKHESGTARDGGRRGSTNDRARQSAGQSFGGFEPAEQASVPAQLGVPVSVFVAEPQRQNQVQMVVPAQQVAMRIGELAKENRTDQARNLADELNRAAPEYKVGRSMWVAFNATTESAEVQNKQVVQLAEEAKEELESVAKLAELHRKLEPRLWLLAMGEGLMSSARIDAGLDRDVAACSNMVDPISRQIATQSGVELRDFAPVQTGAVLKSGPVDARFGAAALEQGVVITVLVTSTEAAILEQLKAAGLVVEDVQAKAKVVVGVLPVGRLAEFALLECVRRVEPTTGE